MEIEGGFLSNCIEIKSTSMPFNTGQELFGKEYFIFDVVNMLNNLFYGEIEKSNCVENICKDNTYFAKRYTANEVFFIYLNTDKNHC